MALLLSRLKTRSVPDTFSMRNVRLVAHVSDDSGSGARADCLAGGVQGRPWGRGGFGTDREAARTNYDRNRQAFLPFPPKTGVSNGAGPPGPNREAAGTNYDRNP